LNEWFGEIYSSLLFKMKLLYANLEKDTGISLQIFLSERFHMVIKLLFYVDKDESTVHRFSLLLYKKFTVFT